MAHRYSSTHFILAFGGAKSKEGIGRALKPAHGARGILSQTRVLYTLFYHFR